ncbi:MAG TPA: DUF4097 family beta strand repeat-containing protein [Acidobacteriaceae bacterium]|jgi:DUF4097 and DUF4098 domain-containing protein YvlB|nr:DUF4097 family beta strand repeat-containing protein [Acidobacteriaceae bacterium]
MSSQPPFTPPGGTPPGGIPPYDPRTQWRVYREQQRAAWRAQREAWKAQRHAWKAGYGSAYGPHVPSVVGPIILVGIGIVGLLIYSGRIAPSNFWSWYGHWWPLLLIAAGLALLGEWALDLRRTTPVRRGGGFVGILILLALLGCAASGWNGWWGPMRAQWGDHDDSNFFNLFGLPERDQDQQLLNVQVPANALVQIQNPRGDVSVTAGDNSSVEVQAHEVAFANSDTDAKRIFDAEQAHITVSGNTVLVKSDSNNSGRLNLSVTVPKGAQVTVTSGHGDVTAAGLGAGANITSSHGDVHLSTIQGSVQVHFSNDRGDFSAHEIGGDLTADGNCNDLTFSEIKGKVTLNGEIFGDVHLENIGGPVHLHTSVTELQLAALPGDMTLNSDDLRVTEARGEVRVTTHAKDVDLSQIYGDSYVDDSRGQISVEPAGNYSIEAKSGKGDVEVTLPPEASANIEGHTHNGDIVSDYPLVINGDESKSVSGRIGSGQAKINLIADVGDLRIKKGSGFTPVPPSPPGAPASPNAPHLKAPKAPPEQPVTQ